MLELIGQFGADGVRYGIMASACRGDILFDEKLCELGRNFCNKIWNALRLVKSWNVDSSLTQDEGRALGIRWIQSRMNEIDVELRRHYAQFRLSEGVTSLYSFVWDDFCSVFLEIIKPAYGESSDAESYESTIRFSKKFVSYFILSCHSSLKRYGISYAQGMQMMTA
jgi:valyl-tRNA synthetase